MKIIGKCESCGKIRPLVRKRVYKHKHIGIITSQSEVCGHCHKAMKHHLKDELV